MLYGSAVWDPAQIVTQIAAIQFLFYIGGAVLMALFLGSCREQKPSLFPLRLSQYKAESTTIVHNASNSRHSLSHIYAGPYALKLAVFHLFDWRQTTFNNLQGWMVFIAFFINSFLVSIAIRFIVKRAKKCLDFSATVYFIHLVAVSLFSNGIPRGTSWWLCTLSSFAITAVFSEWLCLQDEMKEIPLASIPSRRRLAGNGSEAELTSVTTQR
jgi:hypothetical protein